MSGFDLSSLVDGFEELEGTSRETYVRAPFGWPGGKYRSLSRIIPELKKRAKVGGTWVDGCGGSGVISLNLDFPFSLKVFNDRHTGVVAFYRCFRDPQKLKVLKERLEIALHSREEFIWSRDTWKNCEDDVERAARWYYTIRMSFAQLGRNFGRATQERPQQASAYFNSLEEFNYLHRLFKGYQVENMDVVSMFDDYDSSKTLWYIDPDYIGTNPCYKHSVDHSKLLERIKNSRGCVVLSGYANELYDSALDWDSRLSWEVHVSITSQAFTDSNALSDKRDVMGREQKATEVLWIKEYS